MEVPNNELTLSRLTVTAGDEAIIKIYSTITVNDSMSLANDILYLEKMTSIRKVTIFVNSGGGNAFDGLSLSSEIEAARNRGFYFVGIGTGLVASAALPPYIATNKRIARKGTIFLIHPVSLWTWPGIETAGQIKAKNDVMELIKSRYLDKLVQYSTTTREELDSMMDRDTWLSEGQAMEMGLVDKIE